MSQFPQGHNTAVRHLGMVVGLGCLVVGACSRTGPEICLTSASFDTDAERAQFVGCVCGVELPATATEFQIEYVQWLDLSLDASFTLPQDDFAHLLDRVRGNSDMAGVAFQVDEEGGVEALRFVFPETGRVCALRRGAPPARGESGCWFTLGKEELDPYLDALRERGHFVGETSRVCDEEREIDSILIFVKETRRIRIRSMELMPDPSPHPGRDGNEGQMLEGDVGSELE